MLVVVIREKMEGKTGQRKGASPVSPFQGAPREAREAQVFRPCTLGLRYSAQSAQAWQTQRCDIQPQSALNPRRERKGNPVLAAAARVCPKAGAVGNSS